MEGGHASGGQREKRGRGWRQGKRGEGKKKRGRQHRKRMQRPPRAIRKGETSRAGGIRMPRAAWRAAEGGDDQVEGAEDQGRRGSRAEAEVAIATPWGEGGARERGRRSAIARRSNDEEKWCNDRRVGGERRTMRGLALGVGTPRHARPPLTPRPRLERGLRDAQGEARTKGRMAERGKKERKKRGGGAIPLGAERIEKGRDGEVGRKRKREAGGIGKAWRKRTLSRQDRKSADVIAVRTKKKTKPNEEARCDESVAHTKAPTRKDRKTRGGWGSVRFSERRPKVGEPEARQATDRELRVSLIG